MTDITLLRGGYMVAGFAGRQRTIMTTRTTGNDTAVIEINVGPIRCRHVAGITLT